MRTRPHVILYGIAKSYIQKFIIYLITDPYNLKNLNNKIIQSHYLSSSNYCKWFCQRVRILRSTIACASAAQKWIGELNLLPYRSPACRMIARAVEKQVPFRAKLFVASAVCLCSGSICQILMRATWWIPRCAGAKSLLITNYDGILWFEAVSQGQTNGSEAISTRIWQWLAELVLNKLSS